MRACFRALEVMSNITSYPCVSHFNVPGCVIWNVSNFRAKIFFILNLPARDGPNFLGVISRFILTGCLSQIGVFVETVSLAHSIECMSFTAKH